ncbi:MAG TPA: metallophosphoesterase [Pyrinomonadaceae bacterium]
MVKNPKVLIFCKQNSAWRACLLLTLAAYVLPAAFIARGQNRPAPLQTIRESQVSSSDAPLNKLPPRLRAKGLSLLKQTDETKLADSANALAAKDPAAVIPFLISVLETDRSARVRRVMISVLGKYPRPEVRRALAHHAASDPDVGVAILALDKVRLEQTQEMRKLLLRRMEMARQSGDEASFRQLAQEQERWVSLTRGTMLPAFLRMVPPIFSLKPAQEPVRVLAFGDFGNGSAEQKQVAAAMLRYHHLTPFDFALTLGDNFYDQGMLSLNDPRWQTWWAALYDPLGIKFYATFGNHDWGFGDSPAAEILYTERSQSWRLPAPYYTFTAGPVQFFALDTNEVSEAQKLWLKDELEKSRVRWKVVYGHHPIYSAGTHGDNNRLIRTLLPLLKERADIYLAGHDHDLEHLKPEGGLHFFISGGGGAGLRQPKTDPRCLFAKGVHGFTVLEADATDLKVSFIGTDGVLMYAYTLKK